MIHSDEERRLKDYLDEIDEELEQISALNPLRFRLIKRVQKFKYECQEAV